MIKYFEKYNILNKNQFGFRDRHNTSHAILSLVEDVTDAFEENKNTIGVFVDFKKAFDTVNHEILKKKLEHYGVRGQALNWLTSYLYDRSQFVTYANTNSRMEKIVCGVPQGSILGPILFLIYINDIGNVSKKLKLVLFADDTNFFLSHTNITILCEQFNQELEILNEWFCLNKLSLNLQKTSYMIFRKKNQKEDCNIMINGTALQRVYSTRFLGVVIDDALTWKKHIDIVNTKMCKNLSVFYKVKNLLDFKSLLTMYYSLILPYLMYCSEVWGLAYKTNLDCLRLTQNKVVRLVLNSRKTSISNNKLYKNVNLMPFANIVKYKILCCMHMATKNMLPITLSEKIAMLPTP